MQIEGSGRARLPLEWAAHLPRWPSAVSTEDCRGVLGPGRRHAPTRADHRAQARGCQQLEEMRLAPSRCAGSTNTHVVHYLLSPAVVRWMADRERGPPQPVLGSPHCATVQDLPVSGIA